MIYLNYNDITENKEDSIVIYEAYKKVEERMKKDVKEIIFGSLFSKIIIDNKSKSMKIKGINYDKFLLRIKDMYNSRGVSNLFGINYTKLSQFMYKHEKINKRDMKITNLEVPLFFALEIYKIFIDMGSYYNLPYYKIVADKIYKNTWISKYEKRNKIHVNSNMSNLSNLAFMPQPYQKEFIDQYQTLKYVYDLEGYILSFDQGLGKTFTSIGIYETMPYEISQVIIVAPNSTLQANWALEIKQYYPKYKDNDELWKKDVYVYNNNKFKYNPDCKFVIVNMDSIPKIYQYAKKSGVMIIVDECHNFRNMNSLRSKDLIKLKQITQSKDCLLLSGTPIKATPDELIPALMMIDPYFSQDMAEIYKKAFDDDSATISSVVKARYGRVIYRKTKEEALALPKKNILDLELSIPNWQDYTVAKCKKDIKEIFRAKYEEKYANIKPLMNEYNEFVAKYSTATTYETKQYLKYINMTTQTGRDMDIHEYRQEVYKTFLKDYVYPNITDQNDFKRLKYVESQYIYMRESAMGYAIGQVLPKARTNVYIDLYKNNKDKIIRMINDCSKKTIIFSPFLGVVNYINDDLAKSGIGSVKIIGETKDRMDVALKFKNEDVIDVLCATTQTLSTGVTLTEASQMFFFGTPFRSADFNQACDRIYRIGQTSDVYIYTVLLQSPQKNITQRIKEIMDWSDAMFNSLIN